VVVSMGLELPHGEHMKCSVPMSSGRKWFHQGCLGT